MHQIFLCHLMSFLMYSTFNIHLHICNFLTIHPLGSWADATSHILSEHFLNILNAKTSQCIHHHYLQCYILVESSLSILKIQSLLILGYIFSRDCSRHSHAYCTPSSCCKFTYLTQVDLHTPRLIWSFCFPEKCSNFHSYSFCWWL